MILNASTALFAAHQVIRSARCVPGARQMPFSKAETALLTILAWHRSCGVPHEETVVAPISVACTPHDPELHMTVIMCVAHDIHWLPSTEMAQRIAEEMDITKVQVEAAREAILAAVKDALR